MAERAAIAHAPTEVWLLARVAQRRARRARGRAARARRREAVRPPRRPARGRPARGRVPARSSTESSRSTTRPCCSASACRCGDPRASCATAADATTCSRASDSGSRRRRNTPAGSSRSRSPPPRSRTAGRVLAVVAALARGRRVHRDRPLRAARTGQPSPTARAPVLAELRRRRQARPERQRHRLLPVVGHLGGRLGARRSPRSAARCASRSATGAPSVLLVPALVAFLVFMGLQGRYFGRWLMPVSRSSACWRAYAATAPRRRAAAGPRRRARAVRRRPLRPGRVDSASTRASSTRAPTRARQTLAWLEAHVPAHTRMVVEPIAPAASVAAAGPATRLFARTRRRVGGELALVPAQPGHARELRAHALTRAGLPLPAQGLLLGRDRIDRGGPRVRRPGRGAGRDRLLPRARRAGDRGLHRGPYPRGAAPGAFQLRLVVRLLPVRLCTARPALVRLPAA